ncbi:MAG: hypothetical protein KOO66_10805 [Bacteroidales bacterium]|nr:hypothetical protein [Bacteroidales bacterium]
MYSFYKKLIIILSILGLSVFKMSADNNIKNYEDSLKYYFSLLATEVNDQNKEDLNDEILKLFRKAISIEGSFDYSFDSLIYTGVIYSSDNKVKIITWNLPYNNRTYKYFGFIQYKKSGKRIYSYELHDNSEIIKKPEYSVLSHENWYGALYYKIIVNKYAGKVYYTLLGADLNNLLSKKKLIEILYFDKNELPVLGKLVFKNRNLSVSRIIFEFNAQSNMVLTYDEEKEMIIYDHLSPSRPGLQGQYEFYGPDFSYDGLKFERGIWNSYQDIDVRNFSIKEF